LVVVIKGPVAMAGSIFILLSNKGTTVPNKEANIITEIKDISFKGVSLDEIITEQIQQLEMR
jgi:hypothetical protein